jgi:hypothetical protein
MEDMGKRKIVDKTIRPLQFGLTSLNPAAVTGGRAYNSLGTLPIGNYKGQAAFFDLDKLANQPLVNAESLHITGILDGREEGYDLVTVKNPAGALVGTQVRNKITVPAGEVWFINAIVLHIPADATSIIAANWRCSLWHDRSATPDPDGQAFNAKAVADTAPAGAGITEYYEFHPNAPMLALVNKPIALRLPAGAVITLEGTVTTAPPTADVDTTLSLYGYVGKSLVA